MSAVCSGAFSSAPVVTLELDFHFFFFCNLIDDEFAKLVSKSDFRFVNSFCFSITGDF